MSDENHNQKQDLIRCFSAVFPSLGEEEITRAAQASMPIWDSLRAVTLLSVIEDEFGIEIPPQELENLVSFDMFLHYLADAPVKSE